MTAGDTASTTLTTACEYASSNSASLGESGTSYVRHYSFVISNINIMDTLGYSVGGQLYQHPGDNVIRLYIAQVPEDNPDTLPLFRMAEVTVNTDDNSRNVTLTPADFQLIQ